MSILKEFKDFAIRGNVLDMAIGVVIGGAFGTIVTSLVKDVIMPPIGVLMGGIDFSSLYLNLTGASYASLAEADAAGAAVIRYGLFINAVISFLIIAFAIFLLIKQVNRFKKPAEAPAPEAPPADILLLTEIRDLLKKG